MLLGFIIMALIPIMIICMLVYLPIYLFQKRKGRTKPFLCHLARYLLMVCVLSLVYLTILWGGIELDVPYHLINLRPFVWVQETYKMGYMKMFKQLAANILMFVPYGFLLPAVFKNMRKWWRTDLLVFGTSFTIEFIQYFIGRSCDVDDLIMNTVGGCIGYAVFSLVFQARRRAGLSTHRTSC